MDWLIRGAFRAHSGETLGFKIECDALTDEEIATFAALIAERRRPFSSVVGVPRGGLRLAEALVPYISHEDAPLLIVDDVLTTGRSMEEARRPHYATTVGVKGAVMFARRAPAAWITPVFSLWR